MNLQHFYTHEPISIRLIAKENWMFPWIEHYSRVVRNQLAHSNIASGKKTILINTFANIDNFLFKWICDLRLVTGSQKIGPLIIFLRFKLFLLVDCSSVLSAWTFLWNFLIICYGQKLDHRKVH